MKLRYLIFTLFIFIGSSVYAQSYYEMSFHFGSAANQEEEFKAFYLLNGDGTGLMRISKQKSSPQDREIVECNLTQGFAKDKNRNTDYSKMYYTGVKYKVIEGEKTLADGLPPISFWFKMNVQTNEYDPWAVMTKNEEGKNEAGVISGIRLLGEKDMTRELVLKYFTKNDELYKNLFQTNTRVLTNDLKASRLFLLTVIDTQDEKIGQDCETDRKNQQSYFTKIATKLEIPIIIKELLGKDLSRINVLSKINEITPTQNDIVIFYYSGHGYSKEDNRLFPYLDLRPDKDIPISRENELNMEEIYGLIKNKPSRLNLVISDCCNWHPGFSNVRSTNIANTRPSPVGLSIENMKTLFMSPERKSMMITAAAKGQLSAGNRDEGGIFTSQFRDALQKYMGINYQNITWQQITENAQAQTANTAAQKDCQNPENEKEYKPCKQTPMVKVN